MGAEVEVEMRDFRRFVIPQGRLDRAATEKVADAISLAADDGYLLVSVSARQKDIGNQRDPHIVTEAVVLHFERSTA